MELAMTNGFSDLSLNEMEMIDGGNPVGVVIVYVVVVVAAYASVFYFRKP